jgi:hypothetical protein
MQFVTTRVFIGAAVTNPAINTVLATSGAVTDGPTSTAVAPIFILTNGAAAASLFKIQIWNGTTEVTSFFIMVPANDSKIVPLDGGLDLANGNHVRILNNAAITGTVQCVIMLRITGST